MSCENKTHCLIENIVWAITTIARMFFASHCVLWEHVK